MEPMYYIGLDVHKRKISYCVKDSGGKVYAEGSLPATRADLDLCSHGALRICGLSRARHFPAPVERISSRHSSCSKDCCCDCYGRYLHFCVGKPTEVEFLPLTGISR